MRKAHLLCCLVLVGCKSTPAPPAAPLQPTTTKSTYPSRPTTPPPPIHLFHTTPDSITLTTTPDATDEQIAAILWQLRDANHAHAFDRLHIPQKLVDARSPYIWFHLYRGSRCASEKYTTGKYPCGASYHAAGDYTLGGFKDPNHEEAILLHGEDHSNPLWDPTIPYTAPTGN
jgi:hypothetical protein